MNSVIKINGYRLPVNLSDMDFMDRLIAANETMSAAIAAAVDKFAGDDAHAQYKRIDACVNATCQFFDEAFGAGTADKIFRRTNDAAVYLRAIRQFNVGLEKQSKAVCRRFRYPGTLKFDTSLALRKGTENT